MKCDIFQLLYYMKHCSCEWLHGQVRLSNQVETACYYIIAFEKPCSKETVYFPNEHAHGTLPSKYSLAFVPGNTLWKVPSEEVDWGDSRSFHVRGFGVRHLSSSSD